MKNILLILASSLLFYSCFEVKKLEITDEVREELDKSKAIIITPAEISGVANDIGDSLFKNLPATPVGTYTFDKHTAKIISSDAKELSTNKKINDQYQAYLYSFKNDSTFKPKSLVQYRRTDTCAYYQNAIYENENLKLVLMTINLEEVNLKIARGRKRKKK